jgi:hypothetical protein
VKTLCVSCGSTISVNCDHCGAPLLPTNLAHSTFFDALTHSDDMVCLNGLTPIIYTQQTIDRTPINYALCETCKALPREEREALAAKRRLADPRLPSAADLDIIVAERDLATKHETETRGTDRTEVILHRHEKRGPTRVTRSATTHVRKPKDKR